MVTSAMRPVARDGPIPRSSMPFRTEGVRRSAPPPCPAVTAAVAASATRVAIQNVFFMLSLPNRKKRVMEGDASTEELRMEN